MPIFTISHFTQGGSDQELVLTRSEEKAQEPPPPVGRDSTGFFRPRRRIPRAAARKGDERPPLGKPPRSESHCNGRINHQKIEK